MQTTLKTTALAFLTGAILAACTPAEAATHNLGGKIHIDQVKAENLTINICRTISAPVTIYAGNSKNNEINFLCRSQEPPLRGYNQANRSPR